MRPTGGLYINPMATNPFEGMGSPLTLGNAPQYSGPETLLNMGLGGNPFKWSPTTTTTTTTTTPPSAPGGGGGGGTGARPPKRPGQPITS